MYRGWHQIAFERELTGTLSPARIGDRPLVVVRDGDRLDAYDAVCPHRGANLAHGGELDDGAILCPFHGYRVGLGLDSTCAYRVRRYRTMSVGGLLFALLDERHENGLTELLERLDRTHYFVQGFRLEVQAPPELVIENGFDRSHFKAVHGLENRPDLRLGPSVAGELVVEGQLEAPSAVDGSETADFGFTARVFSPNLCITRLLHDGSDYWVISGATATGNGHCAVRVSVAAPPGAGDGPPNQQAIRRLLRDSRMAYEQDMVVWENMTRIEPSYSPDDDLVQEFHRFCGGFLDEAAT